MTTSTYCKDKTHQMIIRQNREKVKVFGSGEEQSGRTIIIVTDGDQEIIFKVSNRLKGKG